MDSAVFLVVSILIFTNENEVSAKSPYLRTADDKIVGGYNISIEEVPYQAYLDVHRGNDIMTYGCGGVIINARYILTAAHCLFGATSVLVKIGSNSRTLEGTIYKSENLIIHPKYNDLSDYDFGIVKLNQDMKLDGKTSEAALLAKANTDVPEGTPLLISGWGATTDEGTPIASKYLLAVEVPSISRAECAKLYKYQIFKITDRMICGGLPQGGKSACKGDSGGPVLSMKTKEVVGTVSYADGCARPGKPGVYTNIAAVRSWIDLNTKI